jgi:tripartite-type tricarboxylate transporter receptor subunit TctC
VGRPIFTTPNVPAERVKALRTAFDAMIKDEQFRAEAEKSGLELDPLSGEEVQKVIEDILATPKPIVARLVEAVKPEHSK